MAQIHYRTTRSLLCCDVAFSGVIAGKTVVVLDAAVLLEAGWEDVAHEVWVTILPVKEVIFFCFLCNKREKTLHLLLEILISALLPH